MRDLYSFSTEFGAADELFKAVLSLDKKRVSELREAGVTLSENVKRVLVNGGGSMMSNKPESRFWYLYLSDISGIAKADFVFISREFFKDTGTPLYYSDSVHDVICKHFFNTEVFTCLLECYDQKKMNKTRIMRTIIQKNNVGILELCAKHGWLRLANKRDEMIEYSTEQNCPECTAWLLEFKNRTADLKAERVKAEKKLERELNAAPDSVSELKKLWSWKKQEDGTLIITSYKGEAAEVTIPAKIGNNAVTAIDEYALSATDSRAKNKTARMNIEKIVVPSGVKTIGKGALGGEHRGVTLSCLREVVLPETLDIFTDKKAAESAESVLASGCSAAAVVPKTENARFYCIKNIINFRYYDEDEVHIPRDEVIASDALYSAILSGNKEKYDELKKGGAALTDYIKRALLFDQYFSSVLHDVQNNFLELIFLQKNENAEFILSALKSEIGEPLFYSNYRYKYSSRLSPEDFDCFLEYFNTKFLDRIGEMRQFIIDGKIEYLAVCAKHGWLKNTATRDKLIAFSTEKGKTEATAWLLDFKNKNFDLAAERKRTEKRLERALNAPLPTSEELRAKADKLFEKMFTYEIAGDEVIITGYKGSATEVVIPREFDGKPVVAVAKYAFYPHAGGVPTRHRKNRENVTKVTLPDTVREIGEMAFLGCGKIKEITVPGSVTKIGARAVFTDYYVAATLIVEQGSYAEEYCSKNGIKYKY